MTPFIEFEAKNVERAVTKACEVLKIPRDQLKHEVLSFGATGIFGLVGIKKARIRVTAPGTQKSDTVPCSGGNSALPADESVDNTAVQDDSHKSDSECTESSMLLDSVDRGRLVLRKLVDSMTSDAEIVVESSSKQIVYSIRGGNSAALIGKRGQTLEAIQYLIKKIVNKSSENRARIIVDIEGYFSKRQDDLQKQASRIAEKACQNGKPMIIGRFNPQDRKTIHIALKHDPRVKTQSMGEGYLKKIIVLPRKTQGQEPLLSADP
ncbi:MAG: Jag N-terminal domain-containing protein [Deltaproteobacteria bacterium]|nr:Jag N-terminal domain-containing protein [Deltaproteobacteria bacterium]